MAQIYDTCEILDFDGPSGSVACKWTDSTKIGIDRVERLQNHAIPLGWSGTEEQLKSMWADEVPDAEDIPQWVVDQATAAYIKFKGNPNG